MSPTTSLARVRRVPPIRLAESCLDLDDNKGRGYAYDLAQRVGGDRLCVTFDCEQDQREEIDDWIYRG